MGQDVGFILNSIKTEQYAIIEDAYSEKRKTNFKAGVQFKVNRKNRQVGVYVTFSFEQNKKVFLTIQVSGHFAIKPSSWEESCTKDKIIFPKKFMTHLAMLVIGTARGVLHAKTEGTFFNKFLVPTINVIELVKENVEFILEP